MLECIRSSRTQEPRLIISFHAENAKALSTTPTLADDADDDYDDDDDDDDNDDLMRTTMQLYMCMCAYQVDFNHFVI